MTTLGAPLQFLFLLFENFLLSLFDHLIQWVVDCLTGFYSTPHLNQYSSGIPSQNNMRGERNTIENQYAQITTFIQQCTI
jgi:hypothetical protein